MKNKYRIVPDHYRGYEVQKKRWWFPFWIQVGDVMRGNTFYTIEEAKKFIEKDREKVIYYD